MKKSNWKKWDIYKNDELREELKMRRAFLGNSIQSIPLNVERTLRILVALYDGWKKKDLQKRKTITKNLNNFFLTDSYVNFFDNHDYSKITVNVDTPKRFLGNKVETIHDITLDFYAVYLGYAGIIGYLKETPILLARCFFLEEFGIDELVELLKNSAKKIIDKKERKVFEEITKDGIIKYLYPKILYPDTSNDFENKKLDKILLGIEEIQTTQSKSEQLSSDVNNSPAKKLTILLPRIKASEIIGREKDIKDLRKRLFDKEQVVLMNGMGGIGKTTVAAVYAYEYRKDYKYIVWISQTTSNFMNDFVYSEGLLLSLNINSDGKETEQLYNEIIIELEQKKVPCLMVIDNADKELSKFHNKFPNWHILVTSREKISNFNIKKLGFLSKKEAVMLFKEYYTKKDITDENIEEIVDFFDRHTLTIEILAKTANDYRKSLKGILNALKEDIYAGINTRHSIERDKEIDKVTSYLLRIFQISNLSKDEKGLMENLACLPPEFYTYVDLEKLIQPKKNGKTNFSKILTDLTNKGWLLYNEVNGYKIHRILIDVISKSINIKIATVYNLLNFVTNKLFITYRADNKSINRINKWLPYGKILLNQLNEETMQIAKLQRNIANNLEVIGEYYDAKKIMENSIRILEINLKKVSKEKTDYYIDLARILSGMGDFKTIKRLYDEKINGKIINEEMRIESYSILGTALQGMGNYEEAKNIYIKVKEYEDEKLGIGHPNAGANYSNLATVFRKLKRYDEAERLLTEAIKFDRNNYGEIHPHTAISLGNLASLNFHIGKFNESISLYKKSISIFKELFNERHPLLSHLYSNLSAVYRDKEDYKESMKYIKIALKLDEANYWDIHPNIVAHYSNLASIYVKIKEFKKAKKIYLKAKKISIQLLGVNHPTTKNIDDKLKKLPKNKK